jgi:hypothetical protein
MGKEVVALIIAKGKSNRLSKKNLRDFAGKPMFLHNLQKCLHLFPRVYVSSDDPDILLEAWQAGAIRIDRDKSLCADTTPNIPVYQHALERMGENVGAIVAVQANSPTIDQNLIAIAKRLMEMGTPEVMTVHPIARGYDYHSQLFYIYGSIWGIQADVLRNYGDPYKPNPKVLIEDPSCDIHDEDDFKQALAQLSPENRGLEEPKNLSLN